MDGTQASATLRWHRPLVIAIRVVVAVSLAMLVFIFTRLPTEDMAHAMNQFNVRHADAQRLAQTFGVLSNPASDDWSREQATAAMRELIRKVAQNSCAGVPLRIQADSESLRELAGSMDAWDALAPQARSRELVEHIREQIRTVDSNAEACLQQQLAAVAVKRIELRLQALVLTALVGLAVIGIVLLRRHDQTVLQEQLRFNEQLIDAIPLPLSLRSADGRFMLVNRAFEEKHRVFRKHLLGQPVADTMPRGDAEAIAIMDRRAKASLEPVEETFESHDERGSRHVQVRVLALRALDGSSLTGVIGIQSDITALRRKEAQLIEINEKLSRLSLKMIDAQEDERRRIARDLHDQVGQIVTALKLQLASLGKREQIAGSALAAPIDLVEEVLRHTRDLSASLHPHMLDDLGLESALGWLIERFIRPSVESIELRCLLQPSRAAPAIELVAFRVVQEALTNVVRHAEATRVGVILETRDGQLAIEVIDDGIGFDAGESWVDLLRSTSLGVTSMRERVSEVGGTLHLQSAPGGGTCLRATLPW